MWRPSGEGQLSETAPTAMVNMLDIIILVIFAFRILDVTVVIFFISDCFRFNVSMSHYLHVKYVYISNTVKKSYPLDS